MAVQYATSGAIEIAYETFGEPGDPPVVLIMGLATQMIAWPDEFCQAIADDGFFVVRFDNRDIGLSTHLDAAGMPDISAVFTGAPITDAPYVLADMADDTRGLLDALGIDRAHIVGASMGGMIAQEFALRHGDRTRSLTSVFSTPAPAIGAATPKATEALLTPPPTSEEAAGERTVAVYRIIGSPGFPLDEDGLRERGREAFRRSSDPFGSARQLYAIHASGDRTEQLSTLDVPTLVLHGEDDPLVQVAGGIATAEAIPGAELITYRGMGHDLPRELWPDLVGRITGHARANRGGKVET